MPNLTNLTLAQLRAATKAQLITAISNKLAAMTKRQIVFFLLDRDEQNRTVNDDPIVTCRKDGQIESQTEIERDVETGAKTGSRVITWTYFPGGNVDTITISQRDAADKEIARKVIRHDAASGRAA